MSGKSFSLSVTTVQPWASATAAMIVSSALRGRPCALLSAMRRAQIKPAFSSKGSTRPANSACGPSGPAKQAPSYEKVLIFLLAHPHQQGRLGGRPCDVACADGVEPVAHQI